MPITPPAAAAASAAPTVTRLLLIQLTCTTAAVLPHCINAVDLTDLAGFTDAAIDLIFALCLTPTDSVHDSPKQEPLLHVLVVLYVL